MAAVRTMATRPAWGFLAATVDVLLIAGYLAVIGSEGPEATPGIVWLFASFMALLAVLSAVAASTARTNRRLSATAFIAAGVGHAALGIVGLASIGLPFLLLAIPLLVTGIATRRAEPS
ncbi:hypothetical protein ABZ801_31000 [Actinomadura sp. NPDC047616]|uniref:hypothetical protein n=1 Tax=Actinomadura sp. NPDC047616 TaxID=3155914 RepID=UPI0033F89EB1